MMYLIHIFHSAQRTRKAYYINVVKASGSRARTNNKKSVSLNKTQKYVFCFSTSRKEKNYGSTASR